MENNFLHAFHSAMASAEVSIPELAEATGIPRASLYRFKNAEVVPPIDKAVSILDCLGVKVTFSTSECGPAFISRRRAKKLIPMLVHILRYGSEEQKRQLAALCEQADG